MIKPDPEAIRRYLDSGTDQDLADAVVRQPPWHFARHSIDFSAWGVSVLHEAGFPATSTLYLVGSAATGFSLSPTKAGAGFRDAGVPPKPSDLDFALVDSDLFVRVWNAMIADDNIDGARGRKDEVRKKVYWGRIDQRDVPHSQRPRVRGLTDTIRRQVMCRGHEATIRLYRREQDLLGYTKWCIGLLRRELKK